MGFLGSSPPPNIKNSPKYADHPPNAGHRFAALGLLIPRVIYWIYQVVQHVSIRTSLEGIWNNTNLIIFLEGCNQWRRHSLHQIIYADVSIPHLVTGRLASGGDRTWDLLCRQRECSHNTTQPTYILVLNVKKSLCFPWSYGAS